MPLATTHAERLTKKQRKQLGDPRQAPPGKTPKPGKGRNKRSANEAAP